ncbi:hypothetical protein [Dietzia sp. ANT_WB102]|uniref:hypothetical protein n=1 Tax=Dietzia sp. ANT_WB102 TaxID=2597345 RepID=UPI0011F06722|nr:hypothetical protein [Dietzia sp. ANT_WB102]KAA0916434.1 hypothetical protein FQ137_14515 [Dietzia sp. ANT_WB102]
MNPLDRYAVPDSEFSDAEWDAAEEALREERRELDWTEAQIDSALADGWLIAEKCDVLRQDRISVWADEERARRKEFW